MASKLESILHPADSFIILDKIIADIKYVNIDSKIPVTTNIDDLKYFKDKVEDSINEKVIREIREIDANLKPVGAYELDNGEYLMIFANMDTLKITTLRLSEYEKHMYFAEVLISKKKKK